MDKLDLLASFMQAKSYGYLIGVFSEVQAQQTFSDPAKNRSDCFACPTATCVPPGSVRPSKFVKCTCVSRKIFITYALQHS